VIIRVAVLVAVVGASVLVSPAASAQTRSIVGVVKDTLGFPVYAAEVSVREASTRTDTLGRFYLAFGDGDSVTISVRRIGFERLSFTVAAAAAATQSIDVTIRQVVQSLPTVEVDEPELRSRTMMEGFDYRKSRGNGVFLTRDDIAKRGSMELSNVLRGERGILIQRGRGGRASLRFAQWRGKGGCEVAFWVDGRQVRNLDIDDIPARDVEGIELYDGPSSTPGEFVRGPFINCGTVVIWTRVPMLQRAPAPSDADASKTPPISR
jgi:hypothetical protein